VPDFDLTVVGSGPGGYVAAIHAARLGARVAPIAEKGYGAALLGGFEAARGRYLVMGDADGSYDFREAVAMVEALRGGADLCMGSRFKGRVEAGLGGLVGAGARVVVADNRGDIVSYTNTIEQLGGSGMVVPGRGFLLNNELTDFDFVPAQPGVPDPNLPAGGKRPRSSMSPTIVLRGGRPFLAVGAAGGSTIITTVLQILINRLDLGMSLPAAIAAPRASQRNAATTQAEPAFLSLPTTPGLESLGHTFAISDTSPLDPTIKISPDIGAAAGLELLGHGMMLAAGEPMRRGGSAAGVARPGR